MNTLLKHLTANALLRTIGYRRVRHLGRWMNLVGHGDAIGDCWSTNGEGMVFQGVLRSTQEGVVLEVGAHDGTHTLAMLELLSREGLNDTIIHSFEPSSSTVVFTRSALAKRLGNRVILNQMACSDQSGTASLMCHPGCGTNSLHETELATSAGMQTEEVALTTLDDYCHLWKISNVLFLKIDTEGHDLFVLRGAEALLDSGSVAFIQFEYNSTWIASRAFLRDAFEFVKSFGYMLGKIHRNFVEEFANWDYLLEWFEHANYVAWISKIQPSFPVVTTQNYLDHHKPQGWIRPK